MRSFHISLLLLSMAGSLAAQDGLLGPVRDASALIPDMNGMVRCGTPQVGGAGPIDHSDCDGGNTNPSPAYDGPVLRIPVVVHNIRDNGGAGNLVICEVCFGL